MFEIIVTLRPDFREHVVERCPGLEEAQAIAEQLSKQLSGRSIRVWIRRAIPIKTDCLEE
jgi:hypothetical protein